MVDGLFPSHIFLRTARRFFSNHPISHMMAGSGCCEITGHARFSVGGNVSLRGGHFASPMASRRRMIAGMNLGLQRPRTCVTSTKQITSGESEIGVAHNIEPVA